MIKHDAHVLKWKMQFFPVKFFVVVLFLFFLIGFALGNFYGMYSERQWQKFEETINKHKLELKKQEQEKQVNK